MDPRERLRMALRRAGCTRCGRTYPTDGITILAQRDDIAFVQLDCEGCGNRMLALVTGSALEAEPASDAVEGAEASRAAVTAADVDAMHEFLADYYGDIQSLLDEPGGAAGQ